VEVDAGVIASVEDGDVGGSEGPRSYRSGDGTALYGTCLPVTGMEALGTSYNYELSIKARVMNALTQRRDGIIGRGWKWAARLHVVHIEIVQSSQQFESLRNVESPNAESGTLDRCPDDCACIVRDPKHCSLFEVWSSNPLLQAEAEWLHVLEVVPFPFFGLEQRSSLGF